MRTLLFISTLFLSGCCAFTSKDCGCRPPKPELEEETLKWIAPYTHQAFFVFEDSTGHRDTLQINRKSDTEYCGGDECGTDCRREITTLASKQTPELSFGLTATRNTVLIINDPAQTAPAMAAETDALSGSTYTFNQNITASVTDDFQWNNQALKVLKIKCEGDCSDYSMSAMVVSRDYGLLTYAAMDGTVWNRVN